MRIPSPMRIATLSLLVGGLACAKNRPNEDVGAARDTTTLDTMARDTTTLDTMARDTTTLDTMVRDTTTLDTMVRDTTARDTAGVSDSLKPNQTKSGVTDTRTGESTIPNVTQTRPDQGQPVTSKGDTLNEAIDSSAINRDPTPSTTRQTVVDTSMSPERADSSAADSATTAR
jgi:pentapeptide MXKDX repeat protein